MKNKTTTLIITFFLGGLGIHRFYLGQTWIGILYVIFSWTLIPLIISLIDFIVFIFMPLEKFNIKYNKINKDGSIIKPQNCPICNSKLSIWNTPTSNAGMLLNGEKICTKCFRKSIKADSNFVKKSMTYSVNSLTELLDKYEIDKQREKEEQRLKDLKYFQREENKRNNRIKQINRGEKKPSKFNNEMSVSQIVSNVENLRDLKSIEKKAESFALKYFNTNKEQFNLLAKKFEEAYGIAEQKIFKYQFIPDDEINTPLEILKQSYKVVDKKNLLFKDITNIKNYGYWIEYNGNSLSYGTISENVEPKPEYWNSIIKFRTIVESDKTKEEKKKALLKIIKSNVDFRENFFSEDDEELLKEVKKYV